MLSSLSLLSKPPPKKLTVSPARKTTSPRVKIIQTFLIIPLWELKTRCGKRNVKCFPTLLLSPSRFPCTQLLPLLSLSLSLSGVGSHRIRVALWLFLLPSPRALLFLSLFFLLCKIWLNVCNRTNAHGLTARSSALRCVSMESARDTSLALSLPPRERSLKIRKGQSVEARARRYRRSGECVRSFRPSHRETQRELASERPKTRQ